MPPPLNPHLQSCEKILFEARDSNVLLHGAISLSLEGQEVFRIATHAETDAIYDLASLTKVIAGLTLFLVGKEKGLWREECRVGDFLPEAGEGVKGIALRELLAHESGLPAWRDYFPFSGREEIFASVLREEAKERKPLYSDLGYILLTLVMERVTGFRIDRLWREWAGRGTDLSYPGYPAGFPWEKEIISTENTFHRKGTLREEVNDDNCFRMNSASLHAGLFGSLSSLRDWFWDLHDARIVPLKLLEETIASGNAEFLVGWMKKSQDSPNIPSSFSSESYGMMGFTGSSFFFDPERRLLAIFLASRKNPTHDFTQIRSLRARVYHVLSTGVVHPV